MHWIQNGGFRACIDNDYSGAAPLSPDSTTIASSEIERIDIIEWYEARFLNARAVAGRYLSGLVIAQPTVMPLPDSIDGQGFVTEQMEGAFRLVIADSKVYRCHLAVVMSLQPTYAKHLVFDFEVELCQLGYAGDAPETKKAR